MLHKNSATAFLLLIVVKQTKQFTFPLRCSTDFSFNEPAKESDEAYKRSWQRNCSLQLHPICKQTIVVSYFQMQPFTDKEEFGSHVWSNQSIIQKIVSAALSQCCGSCIKIKFNRVKDRYKLTNIRTKENSDILFPMFTQGAPNRINTTSSPVTIPLIKMPAAMFITKLNIPPKLFAKEVLQAIIEIWPLFGVAMLLAMVAGVVIWLLDTWTNKEQLPRGFLQGSFEGFWWSFITMTTVGYGDIAPKNRMAKIVSMFWILCGITIIALMTAALTTAIGEVSNRHKASPHHGDVGVLSSHIFEKILLMKGNAKLYYKDTVEELIDGLPTAISGFLIDVYSAKWFLKRYLQENDLFIHDLLQDVDQSYYGVSIYNKELYALINAYIEYQKDSINDLIYESFNSLPAIKNKNIEANLLFTTESGIFTEVLLFSLSIIAVLLLFGLTYELCRHKIKRNKITDPDPTSKHYIAKKELEMEEELNKLIQRWYSHLSQTMKTFKIAAALTLYHNRKPKISLTISEDAIEEIQPNYKRENVFTRYDNEQINTTIYKKKAKKKKILKTKSEQNGKSRRETYVNFSPDEKPKQRSKRPLPPLQT